MDPSAGLIAVFFLIVLPLLVIGAVVLRIRTKNAQREEYLARMRAVFLEAGAEVGEGNVYRKDGRIFTFDALISPLISRALSLRLSAFSDSVYEFIPQDIKKDMDPALGLYLATVKEPLQKIYPERWRFFSKKHVEVILSGNRFPHESYSADDLKSDLGALDGLARQPLRRQIKGGVVTYREGFEKDIPAWHWTAEQRRRLPEDARRYVFSFYMDNPYLHLPLIDLLHRLAGEASRQIITYSEDLDFLRYSFGNDSYEKTGLLFSAKNPEVACAADQYLDGSFFGGFLAGLQGGFGQPMKLKNFESMLGVIDRVDFMARRLFDDENSWFSGEYEIVSSTLLPEDVRSAVLEMATKQEARFLELDRRFHHRLLRGERLEELM